MRHQQSGQKEDSDFTKEFNSFQDCRFREIYQGLLESREVYQDDDFVIIPTIGQLVRGSLLLIPRIEFETFAQMPVRLQLRADELVKTFCTSSLNQFGHPLIFEHGARKGTGRSCGIYHAHLHIVPLPREADASLAFSGVPTHHSENLPDAWRILAQDETYIIATTFNAGVYFINKDAASKTVFKSQYMRRWIVSTFGINREYDWRNYTSPEGDLLETVKFFRGRVAA